MDDWNQVPEAVVPMGAAGYIGWTLLGLFGLAALIIAALAYERIRELALIPAGIGTIAYGYAAFPYLRSVEAGKTPANLGMWAGLLAAGLLASIAAHYLKELYSVYASGSSAIPFAGVLLGTGAAGALDYINERLADIPLSWAGAFALLVLAIAGGFVLANRR